MAEGAKFAGEETALQGEARGLDDEVEGHHRLPGLRGVARDHALQLIGVEGGRLFEIDGQAAANGLGVHGLVQVDGRGDEQAVEFAPAGVEHFPKVGEHARRAFFRGPEGVVGEQRVGARIAGADETKLALRGQTARDLVVLAGKAAHAGDGEIELGFHEWRHGWTVRAHDTAA